MLRRRSKCRACRHAFNEHVLVGTGENPADGGVIICSESGCDCVGSWGMNGLPPLTIPDAEMVEVLRVRLQARS